MPSENARIPTYDVGYVDPGVGALGWAATSVVGDRLLACGELYRAKAGITGDYWSLPGIRVKIIMERPVIYPAGRQKADPNDVVSLALMGGFAAGHMRERGGNACQLELVRPGTWKGQVPGDTMAERILDELRKPDRAVFELACKTQKIPLGRRHNVLDAIGLWLWSTGVL